MQPTMCIQQVSQLDLHCHFHAFGAGVIKEVHIQRDTGKQIKVHHFVAFSIAPGLTLALFGGVRKHSMDQNKVPVRGDIHVIIVGDPGLGKSQLLQAAAAVSPRGIYVCGNATTNAGLTVAVVKDTMTSDYAFEAVLSREGQLHFVYFGWLETLCGVGSLPPQISQSVRMRNQAVWGCSIRPVRF
ncbi:hypothetical protein RHMOL_Rhmol03G0266800 [Rhododendron molle]|uniref:Uncharacterized protein n=1 Tax=Rhododendron molle TaxID=49168 RepID=A0ACC0PK91_RHOML|nr:hypothetical protein RHMOL_Rhmol03G0266800 [Rhododendron molle]